MKLRQRVPIVVGALFALLVSTSHSQEAACQNCTQAKYWRVPANAFEGGTAESFPETPFLRDRSDVGVAFSGGGTRSATATTGQLRGLAANGWLDKVKYISAVSGGA